MATPLKGNYAVKSLKKSAMMSGKAITIRATHIKGNYAVNSFKR